MKQTTKENKEMKTYKVTFEDGNHLITGFNGSLTDASEYYIGQRFEFDELKPLVKAIKVEEVA